MPDILKDRPLSGKNRQSPNHSPVNVTTLKRVTPVKVPAQKTFSNNRSPPKRTESPPQLKQTSLIQKQSPPIILKQTPIQKQSPPQVQKQSPSQMRNQTPPQSSVMSPPQKTSPPLKASPPLKISPPQKTSPPRKENPPPPKREDSLTSKSETVFPKKQSVENASPPVSVLKINRTDSNEEQSNLKPGKKDSPILKEANPKDETASKISNDQPETVDENREESNKKEAEKIKIDTEESNGVGDKIKKFEKAAEDANAGLSRPGSIRRRTRTERLGSDGKDDLPPPATPFKDILFDLTAATNEKNPTIVERQQSFTKTTASVLSKWQRGDNDEVEKVEKIKPEPPKIIKPEFKPMASPVDVTIRSPSLGAKIPDQFPSHGTAFRNVASPDPSRTPAHKFNEEANAQNNKACKLKPKEKYSVSKGSSYFTRGSEEIWLVKKKDIEEIEERVLDSFRRAGGNICMRSESMRPSSDSGQAASFSHATMGRNKRQTYGRSESLDPQWVGARSQTLKRQSSVACTCGHDKKTRAKSAGAETTPRPRSRSHGDDNNQAHVLDKYETLV